MCPGVREQAAGFGKGMKKTHLTKVGARKLAAFESSATPSDGQVEHVGDGMLIVHCHCRSLYGFHYGLLCLAKKGAVGGQLRLNSKG